MFPAPWYAPTFYSRTYWPRPAPFAAAALTDFVIVEAEPFLAVDETLRMLPVAGDPLVAVSDETGFIRVDEPAMWTVA